MTGLVRKATLLSACSMLVAASAFAGVPSPGNSTLPSPAFFTVVGHSLGTPDALGTFSIVVRDLANNPINGSSVVLDFSAASDLVPASDQLDAGASTVNCAAKTVRKFSGVTGTATFTVVGAANNSGASPGAGLNGVKVYADGVLLGSLTAAVLDQDGGGGAGANDLSLWLTDAGSLGYFGRSDYDYSGDLGANDLSLWLTAAGALGSSESGTLCP